jgi:hypothetical protein
MHPVRLKGAKGNRVDVFGTHIEREPQTEMTATESRSLRYANLILAAELPVLVTPAGGRLIICVPQEVG